MRLHIAGESTLLLPQPTIAGMFSEVAEPWTMEIEQSAQLRSHRFLVENRQMAPTVPRPPAPLVFPVDGWPGHIFTGSPASSSLPGCGEGSAKRTTIDPMGNIPSMEIEEGP